MYTMTRPLSISYHFSRVAEEPILMFISAWAQLLEAWLALTGVKYHDNL